MGEGKMPYTNPEHVRRILGLTVDDVSDSDLESFIEEAQKEVLDQIAIYMFEDTLSGKINGSNTTFKTSYAPIADSNFDLKVDVNDLEVYAWGEAGSIDTRIKWSLSTIYPDYGTIVLSSAPDSTYDVITATYYYYPNRHIKLNRIPRATALLAGYYYILSEMLLIPEQWMHGAYRFRHARPYQVLLDEYYREINIILGREHVKEEHGEVELLRDE